MFSKILDKLKNMVRMCYVSLPTTDDSNDRHIVTLSQWGRQFNSFAVYPYGLSANAPDQTTQALVFNIGDSQAVTACIPTNHQIRFKDLNPGEVKLGNYLTTSNTYYQETGDITTTSVANLNDNVQNDIVIQCGGDKTVIVGGGVTITANDPITLNVGSAQLQLTSSLLISNVPIQAPDYQGTSGSIAIMNSGLNVGTNQLLANSVNLTSHIHTGDSGGNTGSPKN
jgi:hypothetical protein